MLTYLEPVVWKVSNGDGLHEGGDESQHKDCAAHHSVFQDRPAALACIQHPSEHYIGQRMVEAEIRMGHEVQRDWDLHHQVSLFLLKHRASGLVTGCLVCTSHDVAPQLSYACQGAT